MTAGERVQRDGKRSAARARAAGFIGTAWKG